MSIFAKTDDGMSVEKLNLCQDLLYFVGADILSLLHIFDIIDEPALLLLLPGRCPVLLLSIVAPISLGNGSH